MILLTFIILVSVVLCYVYAIASQTYSCCAYKTIAWYTIHIVILLFVFFGPTLYMPHLLVIRHSLYSAKMNFYNKKEFDCKRYSACNRIPFSIKNNVFYLHFEFTTFTFIPKYLYFSINSFMKHLTFMLFTKPHRTFSKRIILLNHANVVIHMLQAVYY